MAMEIRTRMNGTQGCLAIEGEMTIYTAEALKERLMGALLECTEIELDLSGVTEIDSAGQQLLVLAKLESMIDNKTLRLVRHSPAVVEVIDLCGLAGFFGDPILIHAQTH
jgi:anti-sigma B factor antagonist